MISLLLLPGVAPKLKFPAWEWWGKCFTTVLPMLACNLWIFSHDSTPSDTQTFSFGMLGQVFYLCAMTAELQLIDLFHNFTPSCCQRQCLNSNLQTWNDGVLPLCYDCWPAPLDLFHDFTPSVASGTQTFSLGMLGQVFCHCATNAGQQPMDLFSWFHSFCCQH